MNLLATLEATFTALDSAAFVLLILAWFGTGFVAEHPPAWRPSVSHLMKDYRRRWMVEFLTRDPRIFDITLIDSLRQRCATLYYANGAPPLSFSAGIYRGEAEDLESLLHEADQRLYQAKQSGRARTVLA